MSLLRRYTALRNLTLPSHTWKPRDYPPVKGKSSFRSPFGQFIAGGLARSSLLEIQAREKNMARRLKKVPEFRSREEELDFWATRDSSAYQMEKPEQGPGPRSVKIT